jgi:dihydroorotase
VELVSIRPREILKLPKISIKEGEKANLTIFSPSQKWTLNANEIPSTSKNSPLL